MCVCVREREREKERERERESVCAYAKYLTFETMNKPVAQPYTNTYIYIHTHIYRER